MSYSYLKEKLIKQIGSNNNELSLREIKTVLGRFRLSNKDIYPVCKELESDGILERIGRHKGIKFKIKEELKL